MDLEKRFLAIWNRVAELEIPEEEEAICVYAQGFRNWTKGLLKVLEEPDIVSINRAKIMLLDRFFEWYKFVPSAHRMRLGLHGHTCIFQVFERSYEKLRIAELSISPPLFFTIKQPLPPPPPPDIAGIFLGEGQ